MKLAFSHSMLKEAFELKFNINLNCPPNTPLNAAQMYFVPSRAFHKTANTASNNSNNETFMEP